ncbi:MAG: phosphohistidine phosphatase SixA [Hyphomicrobiales bacterium]
MAFYLVQHGKCLPKEIDPDQSLSAEGAADTERMARLALDFGLKIGGILHSAKTRARQTAEILATALHPPEGVKEAPGLNPLDDVVPWSSLNPNADLMLVGHLPFMERLASLLVAGSVEKPVIRFQNAGIVCLDRDEGSVNWVIRWALVPKL